MATRTTGSSPSLKPFEEGEDITCFLERIQQFFLANEVAEERKVPTLLISLDEKVYKILKSILHPSLPSSKTYQQVEEALKLRFQPRVSHFRKRIEFDRIKQNEGEIVSKFYARIREAAAECNLGTHLEEIVKTKFVTGLQSGSIQERLCEEAVTKTTEQLLEIALNKESALANKTASVNKVSKKPTAQSQQAKSEYKSSASKLLCVHCGKPNHNFSKCKYKTYKCKLCSKVGHLAAICKQQQSKATNVVEVKEEDTMDIFTANTECSLNYISPFLVKCTYEDVDFQMELDTGAAVSCIPMSVYQKIFHDVPLEPSNLELKTYSGEIIKPEVAVRSGGSMCKNPACDCKPAADNEWMQEVEDASGDDETYNSDDSVDFNSSTSSDEGASDSDVDSASGNRVTSDMMIWLILKEKGMISEEKYAEMSEAKISEDAIKFLIPKPPTSESRSWGYLGSNYSTSDELNEFMGGIARMREQNAAKENSGGHNGETKNSNHENGKENPTYGDELSKDIKIAENDLPENKEKDESSETKVLRDENDKENGAFGDVVPEKSKTAEKSATGNEEKSRIETKDCKDAKGKEDACDDKPEEHKTTADNVTEKELHAENVHELSPVDVNATVQQKKLIKSNEKESNQEENLEEPPAPSEDIITKTEKDAKVQIGSSTNTETVLGNISEDSTPRENDNVSNINNTELNQPELKEENEILPETKTTCEKVDLNAKDKVNNKKTKSFKFILEHILKEKKISDKYEYVDVLERYVEDLDKHYENNKATNIFDQPTGDLKQFAIFLNYYSPSSYKYIVENFNTPLPEHRVLCTWLLKDNAQPGLSQRAFKILKHKASGKRLTCALMSRDIFMKNYGFNYEQVDYGGGCNFEYIDKAVMTFFFLLVSLDEDWKIPIGYIFTKHVPAETQAELIRVCLTQCFEVGVDVVAVTLDSPTPAEFLGCSFQDVKNLKTVFKHPVCDRDVAVWIDPCVALRSARNTLKAKRVLHDDQGNTISWSLIRRLISLYDDEWMSFEAPKFLTMRNIIAKVGLTTEIFSASLSPALHLCEELMYPFLFKDTAPMRRYIEIVNSLYDILNWNVTTDFNDVAEKLNTAKEYMIALFCNRQNALSLFDKENLVQDKRLEFRSFVDGKPACGFIAFLICIESFKHLYATLVEKERRINSLNPHRLCKDHAEDFVKNIRAFYHSEDSQDFCGFAFQSYYGYLFDVLEQNPSFSDKNVKLEHWPMKNKFSPAETIKLTSGKRAYDEVYSFQYRPKKLAKTTNHKRSTDLVRQYSKAMDTETDLSVRKNMVGYLAGWIANKFARSLKCEVCIDSLCTDKKQWFHKFITSEHIQGICLPSEELFRICWECERALRFKSSPARVRAWVLRQLAVKFPWNSRAAKHPPGHHIHLARAVISKFIPLRVPAALNTRDCQRVTEMLSLFTSISQTEFFSILFSGANHGEDDNE